MDKNMILFFGKKLVVFAVSMFVLSLTVFYVARFAPGDPLVSYYGDRVEKMSQEEREKAEERLGLREPVHIQYVKWLENAVHGDFGISYKYKRNVLEVIQGRLFNTLVLGGVGFILIFGLALLLGILCVWFEERLVDRIICQIGVVTSCIPEFWFSLVLILIFSVWLKVFPSSGAYSMGRSQDVGDRIFHLILPMTIVVTSHLWYYAYMIRNKLLEEVRADYVLLAKAKGLGKAEILLGHCLRGIMPSYLSLMAVSVSHILGGTYMVEMVFSYPGIGTLSYESARYKDYNLLMVLCIFSGAIVILCSIIAQAINERIDPGMGSREDGR
ncbi:MAG: ABC transporter permease [Lachnospiraceae bacterium]|jgi:peptide/nickel transport system permease protein|nr:ABC transporter permease [Lachnospiraceae bacterium]